MNRNYQALSFALLTCCFGCAVAPEVPSAEAVFAVQPASLLESTRDVLLGADSFECEIRVDSKAGGTRHRVYFVAPDRVAIRPTEGAADYWIRHRYANRELTDELVQTAAGAFHAMWPPEPAVYFDGNMLTVTAGEQYAQEERNADAVDVLAEIYAFLPSSRTQTVARWMWRLMRPEEFLAHDLKYEGIDSMSGRPVLRMRAVSSRSEDPASSPDDKAPGVTIWIDKEKHVPVMIEHRMRGASGAFVEHIQDRVPDEVLDILTRPRAIRITFHNWRFNVGAIEERFRVPPHDGEAEHVALRDLRHPRREGETVERTSPAELIGQPAPRFVLKGVGGETLDLAQHLGTDVVILDFWATWCVPCIRALPVLMDLAREHREDGVVLWAVNVRENVESVTRILERQRWDLTVPMDRNGDVAAAYGVTGLPQTVMIDRDGLIQSIHVGFSHDLREALNEKLEAIAPRGPPR